MESLGQLSPDGNYYWDGKNWTPALSPTGLWRWDGTKWIPVEGAGTQSTQLAPQSHYPSYPQPQVQYAAPMVMYRPPTNTAAVVSLIFGIVSWFVCPLVGGIVAVIAGHMAHGQIRSSGEGGAGMATAGLVLGYIHIAAALLFGIFWLAVRGGLTALLAALGTSSSP